MEESDCEEDRLIGVLFGGIVAAAHFS